MWWEKIILIFWLQVLVSIGLNSNKSSSKVYFLILFRRNANMSFFFSKQDNVIRITSVFVIKHFFSVCFHLWCLFPTLFVFYRQGKCKDMWFPWDTITSPLSLGGQAGVLKKGGRTPWGGGLGDPCGRERHFSKLQRGKGWKSWSALPPLPGSPCLLLSRLVLWEG